MFVESLHCLPPHPRPNLIPHITRKLKMNPPKNPTVPILIRCSRQIGDPPRNHPHIIQCHVTTQSHIYNITIVIPNLYDSSGGAAKRGVCGEVVLMIRSRCKKRCPVGVVNRAVGGQVRCRVPDSGDGTP